MSPYLANIVGAVGNNDTPFPMGGMSLLNEGTVTGEQSYVPPALRGNPNTKPVPFPEPLPQATTATQEITSSDVNPQTAKKPGVVNPGYSSQDKGTGGSVDGSEFKGSGLTAYQVEHYMKGAANVIQAGTSIANGYLAYGSAYMKGKSLEFEAGQHERNAQLLYKNMREINRAADADANVYRVQGAATKSAQKVAMAASGFAVGKGVYKTTLQTTDARTQYNVALLKLKAGLQNAEILRQIGVEEAQAIINKAEASISRKYGRAQRAQGWATGISELVSGGANFYMGYKGEGATKGGK